MIIINQKNLTTKLSRSPMAVEHKGRYIWLANELTKVGYKVYTNDHRGHGLAGISLLGKWDKMALRWLQKIC